MTTATAEAMAPVESEALERTRALFEKAGSAIPKANWPHLAPYVDEVLRLKKERNAVILAHNYMTPDIFHCIADIKGDSLALARRRGHRVLRRPFHGGDRQDFEPE